VVDGINFCLSVIIKNHCSGYSCFFIWPEYILLANDHDIHAHCVLCVCDSYYEDIQKMPAVSEQDMNSILKEESQV